MKHLFRGCLLFLFSSGQSGLSSDSIPVLEEVQVTATRSETEILSVPYSVNIARSNKIEEYQFRTTPESLTGMAGVFLQKTNHGGGSPFIRGLTGNQVLVVVDGVRFNNSTFRYGPNQYLNTIDPYTLSRIEVARGTGSVQYGSDAMGGVVHLFTKDPEFKEQAVLKARFFGKATTQDMEYSARQQLHYQSKSFSIIGGYSRRKFGDLYGGDTTGRQRPSGYDENALDAKLKWRLSSNIILTAATQYLRQEDVPLYHRVKLENFNYYHFSPQQRQLTYAKIDVVGKNSLVKKISFHVSKQNTREQRKYYKNGDDFKYIETDKVATLGSSIDISSDIARNWTANSGVEYYRDRVRSNKLKTGVQAEGSLMQRGLYPDNGKSRNFSVYSLHHLRPGKFEFDFGVRYNSFELRIPDTTASDESEVTITPSSLVGNAGILYHVGKHQTVYTSFSTGYRAPNIDDLGTLGLVDYRYEVPAYDLSPEKSYHTEIGYRFSGKKLTASAAFFYMHLSDLITRVQVEGQRVGDYNVYTKENSQKSYISGVEVGLDFMFSEYLMLRSNVSYGHGQNISENEPMRRIPPLNGRTVVAFRRGKWLAQMENLFASKQSRLAKGDKDDSRIPEGGTPGWYIFNVYTGYTLDNISVNLAFHNLLNKDYRTHGSGINGMGRSASLSFIIEL